MAWPPRWSPLEPCYPWKGSSAAAACCLGSRVAWLQAAALLRVFQWCARLSSVLLLPLLWPRVQEQVSALLLWLLAQSPPVQHLIGQLPQVLLQGQAWTRGLLLLLVQLLLLLLLSLHVLLVLLVPRQPLPVPPARRSRRHCHRHSHAPLAAGPTSPHARASSQRQADRKADP